MRREKCACPPPRGCSMVSNVLPGKRRSRRGLYYRRQLARAGSRESRHIVGQAVPNGSKLFVAQFVRLLLNSFAVSGFQDGGSAHKCLWGACSVVRGGTEQDVLRYARATAATGCIGHVLASQ